MKKVDESIDEKGQKLFKIIDELSKLSEQSRMLQFEKTNLALIKPKTPSVKNISTVRTDMPSSSKKDVRESRANEASSSSSVKTEKISGNPENKTNPDSSGAKLFSFLQVHPK